MAALQRRQKARSFRALFTFFRQDATGRLGRSSVTIKTGAPMKWKNTKKEASNPFSFMFFKGSQRTSIHKSLMHIGICVFQRGFKVLVFGKAHLVEQNKVHLWPCIFVLRYVRYCHATMREDTLGDAWKKGACFISVAASVLQWMLDLCVEPLANAAAAASEADLFIDLNQARALHIYPEIDN